MRVWKVVAVSLGAVASMAATAAAANVVVSPGDSIQAAIDGATAGDTIVIKPGVYNQVFTVTKQLNFKGSPGKSILDGAGFDVNICTVQADDCTFTGLLFRFSGSERSDALSASGFNRLVVTKCTFHGTGDLAIYCSGSDLRVTKCLFRGCSSGVYQEGGNGAILSGNRYTGTSDAGASVYGSALLLKEAFENGRDAGFYFGAAGTISGARVRRAYGAVGSGGNPTDVVVEGLQADLVAEDAVYLEGSGHEIRGCRVRNAGSTAFYISGNDGLVQDNSAFFCGTGTETYGANMQTLDNSVVMCDSGVYLGNSSSSAGLAADNTLRDIWDSGIEMANHASGTVRGNTLARIGGFGNSDAGGIVVRLSPASKVEQNRIGDVDGGNGIFVESSSGVTITDNDIDGVAFSGISLRGYPYSYQPQYYGPTDNVTVRGNSISDAGDPFGGGIRCDGVRGGAIDANEVSDVAGTGIHVDSSDDLVLSGNQVSWTGKDGILFRSAYANGNNVVEGNTVRGASAEGIQNDSGGGTPIIIRNNTVTGSGLRPFANAGSVNANASAGNSPQPADWGAIPPQHFL